MKAISKILAMVVLTITSVGCATEIKVTDPRTGTEYIVPSKYSGIPGIGELAKLCAEQGGREIKKVVHVEGYFDKNKKACEMNCWDQVAFSPLEYLEINVQEPKKYNFINEPGIWKIYKTSIDDPRCDPEIKSFMQTREFYKDFIGSQCLAIKKNGGIESHYEYSIEFIPSYLPNEYDSKITETLSQVIDRNTDEVIAIQRVFSLTPSHSKLDPGWTTGCGYLGIKQFKGLFTSEVFKTKGEN